MRCGPERIFEANFKSCILKGTTRSRREEKPTIVNSSDSNFNCTNKKPGKYQDDQDCHIYHLCLRPELYAPFEHLTVECPHSTAFDPVKKSCSKKTKKLCNAKINCLEPIRFRETRSCDHYFFCYRNEVVKILCPPEFQFDEKLAQCRPKKFVKC